MKTMRIFDIRGLILILGAVLGASVGFASPAFAQAYSGAVIVNPDGKVTHLGTLGGRSSYATDINDSGQVVGGSGTADGGFHAFITGPNGKGMTDIDPRSTYWGYFSEAHGVNDSGQVVGATVEVGGGGKNIYYGTFITGPNGMGMTDLHAGGIRGGAYGINDSGQVVGSSRTADRSYHAFITGRNGIEMTDLGTLGGADSVAKGINDSGQVVGYSDTADGSFHAFITGPNGMGMTDLGTLGGRNSIAHGINDAGQVVGYADTADSLHAFITGPNGVGMTDLNSIADLPNGFYLGTAQEIDSVGIANDVGINNVGQVIATMVPEPASYALMLAGLGLVGFMARRKSAAGNTIVHG